jgi:hypothetical protein
MEQKIRRMEIYGIQGRPISPEIVNQAMNGLGLFQNI